MKYHTKANILIDRTTKSVGALSIFNYIFPEKIKRDRKTKERRKLPNLSKLAFLLCGEIAKEGRFEATEQKYQQFASYASEKLNEHYTVTSVKSVCYRLNALGFLDRGGGTFYFSDVLEKRLEQFIVALRELQSRKNVLSTL